jgi:hypothetical protein
MVQKNDIIFTGTAVVGQTLAFGALSLHLSMKRSINKLL